MKSHKNIPIIIRIYNVEEAIQLTHSTRRSTNFPCGQRTVSDFKERHSLSGGGEVGIVNSSRILNGDGYTVISQTTLSKIVSLEVKRGLCETISNGIIKGVSSLLLEKTTHL